MTSFYSRLVPRSLFLVSGSWRCAVIEKYTKSTRFCIICNYVSKIIPALQSRCTRFRFAPLAMQDVTSRLRHVADCERSVSTETGI